MSHNLKQYLLHALRLAPAFVFPLLVAMPGQYALADASGTSPFGFDGRTWISVKGDGSGSGYGLRITSIKGFFTKPSRLCNWRYDIVFTDTNNYNYRTARGPTNSGCYWRGEFPLTYTPYQSFRTGKVCARLYSNGSYVDAACVNLFP